MRAGNSLVRVAQTGYVRDYALLLLIGVAGLGLYFLSSRSSSLMLSILIFLPLPAA